MGDSMNQEFGPEVAELTEQYKANEISRRTFMRRLSLAGVGVAAAATILAACGDDDEPAATAAPTAAPTPTDAPTPTPTTEGMMAPVSGGQLREGYNRDVSKHDPLTTNWYDPAFFAIYEAILSNDPSGATVPQFASDFSVSDDGLEYRFTIPEGKTSHSGGVIDAEAVAEFYRSVQAFSFIAGLAAPVDTYVAEGNQVVMKMKNAWVGALGPHKTGYWRIININTWKEQSLDAEGNLDASSTFGTESADGTGPFTHEEWVPGSHVLVNKWDDYPGSQTPFFENKGAAYLDSIRWTVISEAGQRATQLENGDIDTLIGPAPQDIERLKTNPDLTVLQFPEWSGFHLAMNRDYPEFFGDVLTRQGLSHSINRQAMVDAILFGNGAPTFGPFPTTDRNYDPAVEQFNQFDVNLANQKLDEAGWVAGGDGVRSRDGQRFEFRYLVEDETVQRQVAQAVQQQFAEVGVQANLDVVDRAVAFEQQSGAGRDAVPMSLFFWLWPIPLDVLILFGGSQFIPVPNFSHAVEPRVDTAIENWLASDTDAAAQAAASEFQLAWAEQLPFLPIMNQFASFVNNNKVHGWQPFVWNLYPYYNDTWIEA
jgi:peptide/nickel transport system substrate-binding protein